MKKYVFFVLFIFSISAYSQQVSENQVPANVQATAKSKLGTLPINSWVKDPKRGYYVATTLTENVFKQVVVGFDGKWQNTAQVFMADQVPPAVMATIKSNYLDKGYEGSNYTYEEDHKDGNYYTVDLSSENEDLQLTLDVKGKILKKEVK